MTGARVRARLGVRDQSDERGTTLVEFSMVSVLLVMLLLGVLQVGALFYVRTVIAASAADGARWAANADMSPADGAARATQLIRDGLSDSMAADVPCTGWTDIDPDTGLELTVVRCVGTIRSMVLPIGSLVSIDIQARSLREGR